jgi:DNA repair exonuclease SbcCD ATPase subunit
VGRYPLLRREVLRLSSLPVAQDTSLKVVKSVWLGDFQSHEDTKIELAGPGKITVLVGQTDSGKTSVVRALRWVLYNVPQGVEFVRVNRNQATVTIEMSDGAKVVRERSRGSVNRYRIIKPGATDGGLKLEGFGLQVPQEVVDVTGVRLVKVGEKDLMLNLSEQLDGPFLGASISSPERARILGKLAGTEEVDEAQRTLSTDIHRGNGEVSRLETEIAALDARIAEYGWLPGLKETIEAVEEIVARAKADEERRGKFSEIRARLNEIAAKELEQRRVLDRWANLDRLELVVVGHVEPAMRRGEALRELKANLQKVARDTAAWRGITDRWLGLEEAAIICVTLERNVVRAGRFRDLSSSLKLTAQGINRAWLTIAKWRGVHAARDIVLDLETSILPQVAGLRRLKVAFVDNASAQTAQEAVLARYARIEDTAKLVTQAEVAWRRVGDLRDLKRYLHENDVRQIVELVKLDHLAGVEKAAGKASQVESSLPILATLHSLSYGLIKNREAQVVAEESFKRNSQAVVDAEKVYVDTLIRMKICPLCGSKVDPQLIKEVA